MAYKVRKTEHVGAKKGAGFWGGKADAKHESGRVRRRQGRKEIAAALIEAKEGKKTETTETETST